MRQLAPSVDLIDLLHQAPNFAPQMGAHLLATLVSQFPPGTVFFCVVDPGVGSVRDSVVVFADGKWYVGPDNGLLSVIIGQSLQSRCWRIVWQPEKKSYSFHGRDLFAPIAAWIAKGEFPQDKLENIAGLQVLYPSEDLAAIIYIDHYGNALTGLRAVNVARDSWLRLNDWDLPYARVFADVPAGQGFWYENSIGLVEIAVNRGNASSMLGLAVGQEVFIIT